MAIYNLRRRLLVQRQHALAAQGLQDGVQSTPPASTPDPDESAAPPSRLVCQAERETEAPTDIPAPRRPHLFAKGNPGRPRGARDRRPRKPRRMGPPDRLNLNTTK